MKKEGNVGENMLKKRIEKHKKQNPESFDNSKSEVGSVMPNLKDVN